VPEKPRRQPRQQRSRALVDTILEAAAQVLAAEGPERTTTNRVAQRAGVSVGSIYQYFPDKHALFTALGERYVHHLRTALINIWPAALTHPPARALSVVLERLLAVSIQDPRLSGMLHLTTFPAPALSPIAAFERELEGLVATFLRLPHDPPLQVPDPDLTARLIVRAAGGIVGRTLASEPHLLAEPAFVREVMWLIERYVQAG
jgi:AcrR family transcriptional regulator